MKTQKLEAVDVLAGRIAHDFNNNLTAILGNVSLARMYNDPGKSFEKLVAAERQIMQAKAVARQLLTFSKDSELTKKTVYIGELLEDSAVFASRGSDTRCEFSIPCDLWPVEIDEGQIRQVVGNMIINADQAMPGGGTIKLCAENVNIGTEDSLLLKDGAYVTISIEDQGVGIPKEHLCKIFDPYFTTKETGSGLGLAGCYSIVRNHGGYISVESEVGVGTTFRIYLPASEKEAFKVEEITEDLLYSGGGRILLMDDEQDVIDTVGKMLIELGYEVVNAKNGTEAVRLYQKANEEAKPFSAVIFDLTIPGAMGAKEAIQKLREIDPDIKAIVSSGYSNDPMMAEYELYGFRGVIIKPYEINELSRTLQRVITGTMGPKENIHI